jgi:hypothetical protein
MRIYEPTPKQIADWRQWVESRPPVVRKIAEKLDPWTLFRVKSTNQNVILYSISEDGTVTVNVTGEYNLVMFEQQVFGIDPNDLAPATKLPPIVGVLLNERQQKQFIKSERDRIKRERAAGRKG